MDFNVEIINNIRLGSLRKNDKNNEKIITTPNCILYTNTGMIPFVTPDQFKHLISENSNSSTIALQLSLPHLTNLLNPLNECKKATNIEGLGRFIGVEDCFLFLATEDIISYNFFPSTTKTLTFSTKSGNIKITNEKYIEYIKTFSVDCATSMCQQCDSSLSNNRTKKGIANALEYNKQMHEYKNKNKNENENENEIKIISSICIAGNKLDDHVNFVNEVVKNDESFFGYSLNGIGFGFSPEQQLEIYNNIIPLLPNDKPRICPNIGSPTQVLEGVSNGIDLFISSYPYIMSENGFAITFPINNNQMVDDNNTDENNSKTKLNLRNKKYEYDFTPILDDCECYSCTKHTKAYIHHLLNTHEMLANVLLMLHNTKRYLLFFDNIQNNIKNDSFDEYKQWFLTNYY